MYLSGIKCKYLDVTKMMYKKPISNTILVRKLDVPVKSGTNEGCPLTASIHH